MVIANGLIPKVVLFNFQIIITLKSKKIKQIEPDNDQVGNTWVEKDGDFLQLDLELLEPNRPATESERERKIWKSSWAKAKPKQGEEEHEVGHVGVLMNYYWVNSHFDIWESVRQCYFSFWHIGIIKKSSIVSC